MEVSGPFWKQPTLFLRELALGCQPRACTCPGGTFHGWPHPPVTPHPSPTGSKCQAHALSGGRTSSQPAGPLLSRGVSWSLDSQGLGSSSVEWAGWQGCPLGPEGFPASCGPARKVLRACLAPRMFLTNVAHRPRPGAAVTKGHTPGTVTQWKLALSTSGGQKSGSGLRQGRLPPEASQASLGARPCPSNLCFRGLVASPFVRLSSVSQGHLSLDLGSNWVTQDSQFNHTCEDLFSK